MNAATSPLLEECRSQAPDVVRLRRRIHENPELGLELPETQGAVLQALEGLGYEVETHRKTSGVVATLRGARPGPMLLLRGDMDALPMSEETELPFRSKRHDAMHACGHDAHVAMLAGAARVLAAHRDDLAGSVRLMFQPGEEGYFGARYMIEEGVLDGVDAAFALHVAPQIPVGMLGARPGPVMASTDTIHAQLRGRGGHASMPHDCNDPIPVACELVQAFQTLVTRRVPAFEPVVLTVGRITAGTTNNVIPETAELEGTLRAISERSRQRALEGIRRAAEGIAAAHEMTVELELVPGYDVTVNDPEFTAFAGEAITGVLGEQSVLQLPAPLMGAEDFGYVLQQVPGAMLFLGVRPDNGAEPAPCHSNRMLLNEDALALGVAAHAAVALSYLGGGVPS